MKAPIRKTWHHVALMCMYAALPALADWGSAESAEFTLNTIPEPAALLVLLAGALVVRARLRHSS